MPVVGLVTVRPRPPAVCPHTNPNSVEIKRLLSSAVASATGSDGEFSLPNTQGG